MLKTLEHSKWRSVWRAQQLQHFLHDWGCKRITVQISRTYINSGCWVWWPTNNVSLRSKRQGTIKTSQLVRLTMFINSGFDSESLPQKIRWRTIKNFLNVRLDLLHTCSCVSITIHPCESCMCMSVCFCVHLPTQLHIQTHEKKKEKERREEGTEQRGERKKKGRKIKKSSCPVLTLPSPLPRHIDWSTLSLLDVIATVFLLLTKFSVVCQQMNVKRLFPSFLQNTATVIR